MGIVNSAKEQWRDWRQLHRPIWCKGRQRKPLQLYTPTNSPNPQTPKRERKERGKKGKNINYTIAINICTTTQCHPMYTTTHCNHHCSPSWCTYTNSTWKDIRSAQNNSVEGYILPPDSPPQHSTQTHNNEGKQIQPTTPTPRKPKPNKAQIKPQTPTLPGDTV